MEPIINHFTDDDLYKFTMCCAVIDNFPRAQVKYSFTDRDRMVYPEGFARELAEQIASLEAVVITEDEIDFMRRRCNYIPAWFYNYLKGYRFDRRWVKTWQDDEGHLHLEIEGSWADTILLEVKILAIISELYYRMTPGIVRGGRYGGARHEGLLSESGVGRAFCRNQQCLSGDET